MLEKVYIKITQNGKKILTLKAKKLKQTHYRV